MPRSCGGTYRSRDSARLSVAVATDMLMPFPFCSEKRIRLFPIQVSPDALASNWRDGPPSTGTTQVSQLKLGSTAVYATREPSGLNRGAIFLNESLVSRAGSPSGNSLT